MADREDRLISALTLMVDQYLERSGDGVVDTFSMSAGESAIRVLAEYGLMEILPGGRLAKWTAAGKDFIARH